MDLCVGRVCMCPLQLLKADGAEEEDDVEQKEAESQPAVQPPAVQMDTQDLGEGGDRKRERFISCCTAINIISYFFLTLRLSGFYRKEIR